MTEIAPAAIPRNHTYFLSPLPPAATKWLLLTHVGYTAVGGPQSIFPCSGYSDYSHYGLLRPLCVSGSPLSEQSALWPPAGLLGAENPGLRRACLRAGCTWLDREGAAAGGLS